MIKDLREKIYSMSNSFLPLDVFYNDIRDNPIENYDKERAYKDIEIIADFIIDLQQQLEEKDKEIERLKTKQKPIVMHSKEDYFKRCKFLEEENIKLQFAQKQLAITELEKMKIQLYDKIKIMNNEEHCYSQRVISWFVFCDQIDNRINDLKNKN